MKHMKYHIRARAIFYIGLYYFYVSIWTFFFEQNINSTASDITCGTEHFIVKEKQKNKIYTCIFY